MKRDTRNDYRRRVFQASALVAPLLFGVVLAPRAALRGPVSTAPVDADKAAPGEVFAPPSCSGEGQGYITCGEERRAPAECCVKGYATCNSGGGFPSGWPRFNGCNPHRCKPDKPLLCRGGKRNTCCKDTQSCASSWGVAYCEDKQCPSSRQCSGGKLCCSGPGICRKFRNVEFCAENCATSGREPCRLTGDYYGREEFFVCCPTGTCRNHPDGWPFCEGEVI